MSTDIPYEILDIIFSFVPSNGLHVSKKYDSLFTCRDAYFSGNKYLIDYHRRHSDRSRISASKIIEDTLRKSFRYSIEIRKEIQYSANDALIDFQEIRDTLPRTLLSKILDNKEYVDHLVKTSMFMWTMHRFINARFNSYHSRCAPKRNKYNIDYLADLVLRSKDLVLSMTYDLKTMPISSKILSAIGLHIFVNKKE